MKVNDLIARLKEHGVETTAAEVKARLGSVSGIQEEDIPSVVEVWNESAASASGLTKPTGTIAKTDNSSLTPSGKSLIPVDPNNLPQVSSLTSGEVTQWIDRIEQSKADGEAQDGRLIQFLSDLYNHRQQAIELGRGAIAALTQQDQELSQVMGDLSSAVAHSLKGLNDADQQLSEIGGGAARLGDSFRQRSRLLSRFHAAIGTHSTQSAAEAESAA